MLVVRKHGTTRSGAFLDPLADKVLVLGASWALVASGTFWWLPVLLITVREIGISAFRSWYARHGIAVDYDQLKARRVKLGWGKATTKLERAHENADPPTRLLVD